MMGIIAALLLVTAALLAAETLFQGSNWVALASGPTLRPFVAVAAGLLVGAISSCSALPAASS
jgi:hypothetical protein